jgi:protein-S-isoprenylcysteine O-methyltransferase Ste14
MTLAAAVRLGSLLWPASELVLIAATRKRLRGASGRDRGSLAILWIAITIAITAGIGLHRVAAARIPIPGPWLQIGGLVLLLGGLAIRWAAILTLGRFFTTSVAIHQDHQLVRTGLFRYVRHPSYSGALLAFFGLAITYGNWLSLAAIFVPTLLAFLYRIHVEESSLVEALGADYVDYQRTTRRLIPGVL